MRTWILAISLAFYLLHAPSPLIAESPEDPFIAISIQQESLDIEQTSPHDSSALSELHASRGEDYLIS